MKLFNRLKITSLLLLLALTVVSNAGNVNKYKQEIIKSEKLKQQNRQNNTIKSLEPSIRIIYDSLKASGIDTICILTRGYPGAWSNDSCDNKAIPWESFIQWKYNNRYYFLQGKSICKFETICIPKSTMIEYYLTNMDSIKSSIIIPCIVNVKKNKKGGLECDIVMIDHTTQYKLFIDINSNIYNYFYTYFDVTEEKLLFIEENRNSFINKWRIEVEKQIDSLNR